MKAVSPASSVAVEADRPEPPTESTKTGHRRPPALMSRWWLDVIVLGVLYEIYKAIRAGLSGSATLAQRNAFALLHPAKK